MRLSKMLPGVICLIFGFIVPIYSQDVRELIVRFTEDREALQRKYSVHASSEYYDRMTRFYSEYTTTLSSISFSSLSNDEKADYVLLRNQLKKEAYFLSLEKQKFDEVSPVVAFATPLYNFIKDRRNGKVVDGMSVAKEFNAATLQTKMFSERYSKQPFDSWQKAERASGIVRALLGGLRESYKFYDGYDPQFTWWAVKPFVALDSALTSYADFLKDQYRNTSVKDDGSGIIGKPIGREALMKNLEMEFIPYSSEELISIAQKQFARCEAEMLKATKEMGLGADWRAALEKVKNSYVPPGDQPSMVYDLAIEAINFLESKELITIPAMAKETWRMGMMSPKAQLINPFFTGGEEISISYPTHTMEHEDKMMSMRGNNPNFAKATVHHELIPGHHLQQFMQRRYKSYRQVFWTPFWVEGWALYWEMNLWDKGFAQKPEEKIGMLFWRMHRCARIIFSLSYHLEKMTPQQCIDLLVNRVGHEYANAVAEVRRSFTAGYDPLYQISYMIGGLQIYQLRKEFVDSGKMKEKDFHDSFLKENCIPIEIVRALLRNDTLPEDFKTRWRFIEP